MRGLCQLSARWHQQFFWTARSTSHQQCLQHFRPLPIRCYRQGPKGRKGGTGFAPPETELKVQEFEQYGSDAGTRRAVDPKREINVDEAEVLAKIRALEKELAILKEGPFGPNSEFIQSLPVEDRAYMLKELESEGLFDPEGDELLRADEIDDMMEDEDDIHEPQSVHRTPAVTLRIPKRQKEYVKRFNKALEDASQSDSDTLKHLNLWKWYLRCQQHVANFSNVMPEDVWQNLWQSVLQHAYRPKHVVILARDMSTAGVDLDERQILAHLNALLSENDAGQALALWEQQKGLLDRDPGISLEYWTLGVQLYAALGRPKKAQDVAFRFLDDNKDFDGRMLVHVISAWVHSEDPKAAQKAWTCYLRLCTMLKDRMTADLYKDISGVLLKSGYSDMALAVFKDMVSSQEQSESDSTDIYRRAMDHFKDVQSQAVTEDHINRIGLTALVIFPKRFLNKFFFGSWIKMLIGQGEIDSAATVVELMYERGVKLDAKHLNGIVGAWLREGSSSSRKKAENLAWSMVNARAEFVKRLGGIEQKVLPVPKPTDSLGSSIRPTAIHQDEKIHPAELIARPSRHLPPFLKRAAPPANIETFSILLLYYTRRSDMKSAEHLTQVMTGPADIKPNSFIMNHWMYAALRSSDIQGVWDKYSGLRNEIRPDLETFAALWDAAKVSYDKARVAKAEKFPSAKALFAEMINWFSSLSEKQRQNAKDDFSPDLHDAITRSFYLSSDLPGMLCALQSMKDNFDQYPDENTTRTVLLLVSRTLPQASLKGPARMRQRRSNLQNSVKMISGILEAIADQHKARLMGEGVDLDKLDPESEVARKANLKILTEFILIVMERMKNVDGKVENEIKTVANFMQVDIGGIDFECLRDEE